VAGEGDWYVGHAPDGPRARAATGLRCVQAGAEKLGVIEASYASAIIGVLSPVSSHCFLYGLVSTRRAAAQVRQVVHAQSFGDFPQPGSASGEEKAEQPARG
jgi:hypothetical protein